MIARQQSTQIRNEVLRGVLCFIGILAAAYCSGQTEYVMADMTVYDCSGILTDSGEDAEYSSNEDFTFIVEMEEIIPVVVTFPESICIEEGFDFLFIWDGLPNVGTLLATITGSDFSPEDVTAMSGVVAFVFTSDNSLNLCGFVLEWEGMAPDPSPPILTQTEETMCPQDGLIFEFNPPIGCNDAWLDSIDIIAGPASTWDLDAASLTCDGDSATEIYIPFAEPVVGNCNWTIEFPVDVRDACDSLHHFTLVFEAETTVCPITGTWTSPGSNACLDNCYDIFWTAEGCLEHLASWMQTGGGIVIESEDLPAGATAGLTLCINSITPVELMLSVQQIPSGLITEFTHIITPVDIQLQTSWDVPVCSAAGDFMLEASPQGGNWFGEVYAIGDIWWVDAEAAGLEAVLNGSIPPAVPLTYTSSEGCSLDTTLSMQYVNAGPNIASCLGAEPFPIEGNSNLPYTWSGVGVSPGGLYQPDSIGVFNLTLNSSGCVDTVQIEILPASPPIDLGSICQSEGWTPLPDVNEVGYWSGPALSTGSPPSFSPENLPAGVTTWYFHLTGCTQLAEATILPIDLGLTQFASCPAEDPFVPTTDFAPVGGSWSGPGIINSTTGLFDPGDAPEGWGLELIYNAPNGCIDTLLVNNITTSIASNLIETCDEGAPFHLHNNSIGSIPGCGIWNGTWPGASTTTITFGSGSSTGLEVENWCSWHLIPSEIPSGVYTLTFEANTCSDTIQLHVFPSELELDPVVVCSDEPPLELAPENLPLGGIWDGSGVHPLTGVLTPSSANPGWQNVTWTAPGGCSDFVSVQVEAWQQASLGDLDSIWCFQDITWSPDLFPSTNCVWELDEVPQTSVELASISTGDHVLNVSWNGAACASTDTIPFTMLPPLEVALSLQDSVLCPGQATHANGVVTGGLPDAIPAWVWSHGGFPIASTNVLPDSSMFLTVTVSDGCSDSASDSSFITVLPSAIWSIVSSDTLCFDSATEAMFRLETAGYEVWWNSETTSPDMLEGDTSIWFLPAAAGTPISWQLIDPINGCSNEGIFISPAFSPLSAGFSVNPGLECIPWDFLPLQLIDYSQFAVQGWWHADAMQEEGGSYETVWSAPYQDSESPFWFPDQPGNYRITLELVNEGGCTKTDTAWTCIHAPVNWFIADQFSPNGDGLNDRLVVRSEPLKSFEMEIFNRWGEQIALIHNPLTGWDGTQRGKSANSGVYAVRMTLDFSDGTHLETTRHVTLVR